jgi:hypothetical protein
MGIMECMSNLEHVAKNIPLRDASCQWTCDCLIKLDKLLSLITHLDQVPRGATMLDLEYPDEFYNAYAEPSETMEVW